MISARGGAPPAYETLERIAMHLSEGGDSAGALESVKAAADFYSPLSGTVVERNEKLLDEPGIINSDPFGEGWFVRIKPSNLSELDSLMSAEEYDEFEKSQ